MSTLTCAVIGEGAMLRQCLQELAATGHRVRALFSEDEQALAWARAREIPAAAYSEPAFHDLVPAPVDLLLSIFNLAILPRGVTSMATRLAVNFHDAPLPRNAGFYATNWALLEGEREHGVSWHVIDPVPDAGDLVVQHRFPIADDETALSLNGRCYEHGIAAFRAMLDALAGGTLTPRPQDLSRRTFHARSEPFPGDAVISWSATTSEIHRLVRALSFGSYENPIAAPRFPVDGPTLLVVGGCRPAGRGPSGPPGTIARVAPGVVAVSCADADLEITELVDELGQPVAIEEEARRGRLGPGARLPAVDDRDIGALVRWKAANRRHEAFWRERLVAAAPLSSLFGSRRLIGGDDPAGGPRRRRVIESGAAPDHVTALAAFCVALSRWTGQTRFDIGWAAEARPDAGPEPFVARRLPLGVVAEPDGSFLALRNALRDEVALLASRGSYSRDLPSRWPALRNSITREHVSLPIGCRWSAGPDGERTASDLDLLLGPDQASPIALDYRSDRYQAETIERLAEHVSCLLAVASVSPERALHELPLSTDERRLLLADWNRTETATITQCLHQRVAEAAARTPEAIAVTCGDERLSYAELDRRANQLAWHLRDRGVDREAPVACLLEPSVDQVVVPLAILKAGGAYVPVDASNPVERIQHVLREIRTPLVVAHHAPARRLHGQVDDMLILEEERPAIRRRSGQDLGAPVGADDLAYVMYTSGSTGAPKGVMIPHRAVVNYVTWAARTYAGHGGEAAPMFSPLGFDLSVTALFTPLLIGQTVVLASATDIDGVVGTVQRRPGFAFVKATPSHLDVLNRLLGPEELTGRTRVLVTGGEPLLTEQLLAWWRQDTEVQVFNEYGPTETTVGCTAFPVPRSYGFAGVLPLGRPIDNTRVYVLDRHLEPVPLGMTGELYVAGVQVARGYFRQPGLTAVRFLPDPFSGRGGRMYRTGDLARWRPDGELEFRGRNDEQIKLDGHRIEPAEIAAILLRHELVREAAVDVREGEAGRPRLVVYVVAASGPAPGPAIDRPREDAFISRWHEVYDDLYERQPAREDAFDPVGWNDSVDGSPIPSDQMREWLACTVARINRLRPRRVLDVGCGNGLVLFRLAPNSERYVGVDMSEQALQRVRSRLHLLGPHAARVELARREASELDGLGEFDLVILNSVVQYFPSVDHLLEALDACRRVLTPSGAIFIGDVRSLPLLAAHHASVELARCTSDDSPVEELRQLVARQVDHETELALAPELFADWAAREPGVRSVRIEVKRGRCQNELTRFRSDVSIHLGPANAASSALEWLDWETDVLSVGELSRELERAPRVPLAVRGIPDARVASSLACLDLLRAPTGPSRVGELKALIDRGASQGVEPEALWELGSGSGRELELGPEPGRPGRLQAFFAPAGEPLGGPAVSHRQGRADRDPRTNANVPLAGLRRRHLDRELTELMRAHLPEYMVPDAIVTLSELPLTPNGKLDRDALPAPHTAAPRSARAPGTPAEVELLRIWSEVLGVRDVGLDDDFFMLGGDSILAIEIVVRARRAGIPMTVAQLFSRPTIAELARSAAVGDVETRADVAEGPGAGAVVATPIQRWFFDLGLGDPWRFNQAVVLRSAARLDTQILATSLLSLYERHDALRIRVRTRAPEPRLEIVSADRARPPAVIRVDLSGVPSDHVERRMVTESIGLQATIDGGSGPLLACALFDLGPGRGCRVLLVAHHLVVDAVSWTILIQDLESTYRRSSGELDVGLLDRTSSFRSWSERLAAYARDRAVCNSLAYWREQPWKEVVALPVDHIRGRNSEASERVVGRVLDRERTARLLTAPASRGAQANEALLVALAASVTRWSGQPILAVDVVGHGREDIFGDLDVSRTVGWFTALYPVVIDARRTGTPRTMLDQAVRRLRAAPRRGLDFGVLRYLCGSDMSAELERLPRSQVCFNYEGRRDRSLAGSVLFEIGDESPGPLRDPRSDRPYLLELDACVLNGCLRTSWRYSSNLHASSTVEGMAASFVEVLDALLDGRATFPP